MLYYLASNLNLEGYRSGDDLYFFIANKSHEKTQTNNALIPMTRIVFVSSLRTRQQSTQ